MSSRFWSHWKTLFIAIGMLLVYLPQAAEAIPAFSRKYGKKCSLCHVQFPKLKEFGIKFKNRGYRMADEEGAYLWKDKVFPVGAFLRVSYLNREVKTGGTTTRSGEIVDDELEAFAGGTIAPRISFFIDGIFTDNANKPLVQFDDILPDSALNIKAGVYNVDNYFLSSPRRLTQVKYIVQTSADRGDNVTFGNEGVEINGQFVDMGFRYVLGFGDDLTDQSNHSFGNHIFVILNQRIKNHTLSLLYRRDRAGDSDDNVPRPDTVDDTHTIGGAVELQPFRKFIIDAAIYQFYGGDSLDFMEGGVTKDYEALSGTVEGIYEITKKVLGLLRYEWHNIKDSPAFEEQYVASLQYHPVSNVKLRFEYVYKDIETGAGGPGERDISFRTQLVAGF